MEKNNIKYFMFSASQMKIKKELEAKLGRSYLPGTVLVGGSYKQFTDIIDDPSKSRFSDSIIIDSGDISTMKYSGGK